MSAVIVDGDPVQEWDRAAQGWHRHASVIREWLWEATAQMLDAADIEPGSRVLDIAAGAGDQTLDIARRVGSTGSVLATDISPCILALAKETARQAGQAQVKTQLANAETLGLDGAGFDAAVCRLGLMFCTSPANALAAARRSLRPSGRFSALVFSQPEKNPCLGIMMSVALEASKAPPVAPFKPGSLLSLGKPGLLAQLLMETGFADIDVRPLAAPFRVPTSQHYIDFVRSAGSPIMALLAAHSPEAQEDAWQEMAERLNRFDTPTGWVGPNELLLCSAKVP